MAYPQSPEFEQLAMRPDIQMPQQQFMPPQQMPMQQQTPELPGYQQDFRQAIMQQMQANQPQQKQYGTKQLLGDIALALFAGPGGLAMMKAGQNKANRQQQQQGAATNAALLNAFANIQDKGLPYAQSGGAQRLQAGQLQGLGMDAQAQTMMDAPFAPPDQYQDFGQRYSNSAIAGPATQMIADITNQGNANEVPMLNQMTSQSLQPGYGTPTIPGAPIPSQMGKSGNKIAPLDTKKYKGFGFLNLDGSGQFKGSQVTDAFLSGLDTSQLGFKPIVTSIYSAKGHSNGKGGEHGDGHTVDISTSELNADQKLRLLHTLENNPLVKDIGASSFGGSQSVKDRVLKGHSDHYHIRLNENLSAIAQMDPKAPALQLNPGSPMQPFASNLQAPNPVQMGNPLYGLPVSDTLLQGLVTQTGTSMRDNKKPSDLYGLVSEARARETTGGKTVTEAQNEPTKVALEGKRAQTEIDKLMQKAAQDTAKNKIDQQNADTAQVAASAKAEETFGPKQQLAAIDSQIKANNSALVQMEKAAQQDSPNAKILRANNIKLLGQMTQIRHGIAESTKTAGDARITPRAKPLFKTSSGIEAVL